MMERTKHVSALIAAFNKSPKEGRLFAKACSDYEICLEQAQRCLGVDETATTRQCLKYAIGKLRALEKASGVTVLPGYLSEKEFELFLDELRIFSKGA